MTIHVNTWFSWKRKALGIQRNGAVELLSNEDMNANEIFVCSVVIFKHEKVDRKVRMFFNLTALVYLQSET